MKGFGIFFEAIGLDCDDILKATILFDEDIEYVTVDTSIWNRSDYENHWKRSANLLLESASSVIFCSQLTIRNVELWIGVRCGENAQFYNSVQPIGNVVINDNLLVTTINPDFVPDEITRHRSVWTVPLEFIRLFGAVRPTWQPGVSGGSGRG